MNKRIIVIITAVLFYLITKEFVYWFYKNFIILNINTYEYFKLNITVTVLSFICPLILLVLDYTFKNLKLSFKIISYIVSFLISLFTINQILLFDIGMKYENLILNFSMVIITYTVLNYLILYFLEKKIKV